MYVRTVTLNISIGIGETKKGSIIDSWNLRTSYNEKCNLPATNILEKGFPCQISNADMFRNFVLAKILSQKL